VKSLLMALVPINILCVVFNLTVATITGNNLQYIALAVNLIAVFTLSWGINRIEEEEHIMIDEFYKFGDARKISDSINKLSELQGKRKLKVVKTNITTTKP